MKNLFLKLFNYNFLFLTGDTLVLDRWLWLNQKIKKVEKNSNFLDVGCGAGPFTIGLNKKNFECLGIDIDEEKVKKGRERAKILNLSENIIQFQNIKNIIETNLFFDCLISFECIEHILDDKVFIDDCSRVIKKNGKIFLTTPNKFLKPITKADLEISPIEDGGHVRVGYDEKMLVKILEKEFKNIEFFYCSGFLSQKLTFIYRKLFNRNKYLAILTVLILRPFQLVFDSLITKLLNYQNYTICVIATKK